MASPRWRQILCDYDTGTEVAELFQAGDRKFLRPRVGGAGSAHVSGSVDLDNPAAELIEGDGTPEDRLDKMLKVYRDGELFCVADMMASEATLDAGTETLPYTAQGPLVSRLGGYGMGIPGLPYNDGTPLAQKDVVTLATNFINWANSINDTGLRVGASIASGSLSYIENSYLKKFSEWLLEHSSSAGAMEFTIDPHEPTWDATGLRIGTFRAAPYVGQVRDHCVFEYGTGQRNVRTARRPLDAAGRSAFTYHLAPGFPDSVDAGVPGSLYSLDAAMNSKRPAFDVISADLASTAMRQALVDEHTRIRKYVRETIFFTPAPNANLEYGVDYLEGDIVPARAVTRRGRVIFDAYARIHAASFDVDAMGNEVVELTLINEAAQA